MYLGILPLSIFFKTCAPLSTFTISLIIKYAKSYKNANVCISNEARYLLIGLEILDFLVILSESCDVLALLLHWVPASLGSFPDNHLLENRLLCAGPLSRS